HIVNLIGSIDDKIENNEKVMQKLEEYALCIFTQLCLNKETNGVLENLIIENPKSKIQVGTAKSVTNGDYKFFTSGASILQFDNYIVDERNIFLNTGGNADIKLYTGKCAYSTDTWSIKSSNLTEYLYLLLRTKKDEINHNYFEGSALRHLQKPKLQQMSVYIPTQQEQDDLNNIVITIFDKIAKLDNENEILQQLKQMYLKKFFG
ncbi:MAG: restriction endonuclease subunit S, partial [Firmicutes bacterium]|nr:restriction endonuclease subunit S [Bacillota bacterium]